MNVKKKKYITIFFTLLQQSKPEKKKKQNKGKQSKNQICKSWNVDDEFMKQQLKESTVVDTRTEEARATGIQRWGMKGLHLG